MRTIVTRVAITLVLFLAAGACSDGSSASPGSGGTSSGGGSETISAADYANGVCTAVKDWVTALQDGSQQYQDSIPATPDPSNLGGIKDSLVSFVDSVVTETNAMIDQIQALGTPDVDGGSEVAQNVQAALQTVQDTYTQLQQDIESLDATNPAEMVTKLGAMSAQLQQGSSEVQAAFQKLDENADMKTAGENAPACQELGNS
jgi:uncharacterized protein YoxC